MLGISTKRLTRIAIITAAVGGAAALASAGEARTHHHYRGVNAAHRAPAVVEAAPPVAAPPAYPALRKRCRNDWQLQGRVPGAGGGC